MPSFSWVDPGKIASLGTIIGAIVVGIIATWSEVSDSRANDADLSSRVTAVESEIKRDDEARHDERIKAVEDDNKSLHTEVKQVQISVNEIARMFKEDARKASKERDIAEAERRIIRGVCDDDRDYRMANQVKCKIADLGG